MTKRATLERKIAGKKEPAKLVKAAPPPAASGYVPAPARVGLITFAIHCLPIVRAEIKSLAAKRGRSVQDIVLEALNKLHLEYEDKPLSGFNRDGERVENNE